jgi:type I restriction enzyme M protein
VADVILANPPFMSPKGGIKPHKRFSVQATRSEVLFVDYMAEHLTATGRAAIVVPEGIIFQGGTAYKALREMLVKTSLVAVVSLPAGVFNPYSGVKTSILFMDKRVHKQTDKILFVKVQNDGFNLGAQRRAVANSDLPEATRVLRVWMTSPDEFFVDGSMAQAVERNRVGEGGDFNLSAERYIAPAFAHTQFDVVRIADICDINPQKSDIDNLPPNTRVSFVPMKDLAEDSSWFKSQEERTIEDVRQGAYTYFRDGDVLVAKVTPCFENGKAGVARNLLNGIGFGSSEYFVLRPSVKLMPELLYHFLASPWFKDVATPAMTGTGGLQRVPRKTLEEFRIPLPPLHVQHEIIAEIASYQNVIDGAKQVLDNYVPRFAVDPDWPLVKIGEIASIRSGGTPDRSVDAYWGGDIPWIKTGQINYEVIAKAEEFITQAGLESSAARIFPAGTILMAMYGQGVTRGRVALLGINAATNQACAAIEVKSPDINRDFLYWALAGKYEHFRAISESRGGNQSNLNAQLIREVAIPVPPLISQHRIVAEIASEQVWVSGNRELVDRMTAKIRLTIDRLWGKAG